VKGKGEVKIQKRRRSKKIVRGLMGGILGYGKGRGR
jgi:hypothetical protein